MAWIPSEKEEKKKLLVQLGKEYRDKCYRDNSPRGKYFEFQHFFYTFFRHSNRFFITRQTAIIWPTFWSPCRKRPKQPPYSGRRVTSINTVKAANYTPDFYEHSNSLASTQSRAFATIARDASLVEPSPV